MRDCRRPKQVGSFLCFDELNRYVWLLSFLSAGALLGILRVYVADERHNTWTVNARGDPSLSHT